MKRIKLSILLLSTFLLYLGTASAQFPSLPHTIKGTVYIDSNPAPIGTAITAKIGNEAVSTFNITKRGVYAIGIGMSPENQGKTVKLYVNGIDANASVVLKSGEMQTVDLSVKTPPENSWDSAWLWMFAVLAVTLTVILAGVKYRRKQRT